MLHSSWDLEVFTRDLQERRWREAERSRQFQALRQSAQMPPTGLGHTLARIVAGILTLFSRPSATPHPSTSPPSLAAIAHPLAKTQTRERVPAASRSRPAHPYAAMPIIARGPAFRPAKKPCPVPDC